MIEEVCSSVCGCSRYRPDCINRNSYTTLNYVGVGVENTEFHASAVSIRQTSRFNLWHCIGSDTICITFDSLGWLVFTCCSCASSSRSGSSIFLCGQPPIVPLEALIPWEPPSSHPHRDPIILNLRSLSRLSGYVLRGTGRTERYCRVRCMDSLDNTHIKDEGNNSSHLFWHKDIFNARLSRIHGKAVGIVRRSLQRIPAFKRES